MTNPAWGAKRICHNCGARFYDMRKNPIICPKCGTEHNPELVLRSRSRRAPEELEEDRKVVASVEDEKELEQEEDALPEDDVVLDDDLDDAGDDDFMEDPSELDGDDDVRPSIGREKE